MKLIASGQLGKNGALFHENEIVEHLSVSRTPIRDAISKLAGDGLIEIIPQVGMRLKEFDDNDLREIFTVRECVEPYASIIFLEQLQSIPREFEEKVSQLELISKRMKWAADESNINEFLLQDTMFHSLIAQCAGLSLVTNIIGQIGDRIRVVGFISTPDKKSMNVVVKEHLAICKALRSKDKTRIETATIVHINRTKIRLEKGHKRQIFNL